MTRVTACAKVGPPPLFLGQYATDRTPCIVVYGIWYTTVVIPTETGSRYLLDFYMLYRVYGAESTEAVQFHSSTKR
jgi:hypothetical protein